MAWDVNDIISIQLKQRQGDREFLNKLFYRILTKTGQVVVEEIYQALLEYLVDFIASVQSASLSHYEQVVLNETNEVDIFVYNYDYDGVLVSGEDMPAFVAMGLVKNVPTRLTKKGGIRIAGQKEDVWLAETLNPAYNSLVFNLAGALESTQVLTDQFANEMSFEPVVVGRNVTGGLDLSRVNPVSTVSDVKVTTQNTRKR